jgi:hypothetical protein
MSAFINAYRHFRRRCKRGRIESIRKAWAALWW